MGETRKWNQPGSGQSAKGGAGPRPTWRRVALCVLLGALAFSVGVALWVFLRACGRDNGQDNSIGLSRPAMIDEAKPTKPSKASEMPKPTPVDPNARPTKVGEVVNGYVLLPSGRLHKRTGVITNSAASRAKGAYHIFDHACDNEIACYLIHVP